MIAIPPIQARRIDWQFVLKPDICCILEDLMPPDNINTKGFILYILNYLEGLLMMYRREQRSASVSMIGEKTQFGFRILSYNRYTFKFVLFIKTPRPSPQGYYLDGWDEYRIIWDNGNLTIHN